MAAAGDVRALRRTLVVRTGALGDVLLLRRAIATLKAAGVEVGLLAPGSPGAALVGPGDSEVGRFFSSDRVQMSVLWARGSEPPAGLRAFLGAEALAYVVSGDATLASNLARCAGRVVTCDPSPPAGTHVSDWLARPLAALGLPPCASVPRLEFLSTERASARSWLERLPERFLALHAGSGSPRKNWPAGRYAELAAGLAPDQPFLVIRGPADAEASAPLLRLPNAVEAVGLPLRVLGALVSAAGAFVGNDSGVAHLAAAAGAPTLALYGPTDPAQWAPVGPSVRTLHAEPLDGLAVEEVRAAASTLWERGPRSS